MNKTDLFDEFSEVSSKAWKSKIQAALKGEEYNKQLIWESHEGIHVKPFYHANDLEENYVSEMPGKTPWRIGQVVYVQNAERANEEARNSISQGAESLQFSVPDATIDPKSILHGIDLAAVPVYFELYFLSLEFIRSLTKFIGTNKCNLYLTIDPIGHLSSEGNWYFNLKKDLSIHSEIMEHCKDKTGIHVTGVDASIYQNAGANNVQQLAYALAHAHEYISTANCKEITFKVAIGGNYFFEIAKIRALRWLWDTLASEYEITEKCTVITYPSRRNKTIYDYNSNLLRTTTESMSAILGGADDVFNMPYDAIYHKTNEFAERMARNQLLILKHESYFDKVRNPADGTYYIEILTQQLAKKALELFKSIEAGGGFLKQLKEGSIQKKIKESASREQTAFNKKIEVLVGINKYTDATDYMKDTVEIYPFVKNHARKTLLEPIIPIRLPEHIEMIRLKEEAVINN